MFGGLQSDFIRRLGKPAAIAGVAIAIVSGPTRAPSSALEPAAPKPVDVVKGGAQLARKREENLEALEGDPDELRSSGAPILDLRKQIVDASSVEEYPESIHLPDYPVPEGRGESTGEHRAEAEAEELDRVAQTGEALRERWREREVQRERWRAPVADPGGAAEPQPERPRVPKATPPAATEPRLAPRMPRMPDVAPVAPRKLGVMPAGPPKRSMVPVPVPVRLVAPKTDAASPPESTPEPVAASVPEPDQAPAPESASEIANSPIEAPEPTPNPDPAPKRAYRPWLADAAESEPVEHEPER